jgi:hypothetical protein
LCIHLFIRSSPADKPFEHKGQINVRPKSEVGRQSATANIEDAEKALFTVQAALFYAKRKAEKIKQLALAKAKQNKTGADSSSDPEATITATQVSQMDPTTVALSPGADHFMQLIHFGEASVEALERIIKDQALQVEHDQFEHVDLKRFLADLKAEFGKLSSDLVKYGQNLVSGTTDAEQSTNLMQNAALLLNRAARKFGVLDMIVNDDKWLAPAHAVSYRKAKTEFVAIGELLKGFNTLAEKTVEEKLTAFTNAGKHLTTIVTELGKVTLIEPTK